MQHVWWYCILFLFTPTDTVVFPLHHSVASSASLQFFIACQLRLLLGLISPFLIISCCHLFFSPFCMQTCILGPCLTFCWPPGFLLLNNRNWREDTKGRIWASLIQRAKQISNHRLWLQMTHYTTFMWQKKVPGKCMSKVPSILLILGFNPSTYIYSLEWKLMLNCVCSGLCIS